MASAQADSEQKEAQQYWGYLFKSDRTGTDLLKNLLRGIHKIIASHEPSDSPDVTPSQLAHFYRSLNGNYDQLFLSTPPSTVAFIYKNLGCVHSMQPLPRTGDRYSDPVIPALKVEGWIIWQTIQLLLGPDEHAEFLRAAVKKWDVKNPETGEMFPKILPRSCFPPHPDAGMVDWYEGVGNRLRQEAEEQEHIRITTIEDRPDTPNDFRHHRKISSRHSNESALIDDSPPENSAIAYFRNPLNRTVDGRPGILRSSSVRTSSRRRPPLSPRDSFVQRGKAVASTVQNVVKNVGSPHLWDGHAAREKERENRRRKSFPDKNHYEEDVDDDDLHPGHSSRRGSAQDTPPNDYHHHHSHNHHRGASSSARPSPTYFEPPTRQRKSHEQPGSREYFPPYFEDEEEVKRPRSDTHLHPRSASPVKAGFMPSVSPLFATHVASKSHRTDSRTGSRSRPMSRHSPDHSDSTRYSAEGSGSEVGGNRAAAYGPKSRAQRFSEAPNVRVNSRKYEAQASYR